MKKKPSANEHKGLVKAKRKAGGLRVQIYGNIWSYAQSNFIFWGVKC